MSGPSTPVISRFRTFYDGVGGFFPLSDSFQALSYESLHVDRSTFWLTATLAKPNLPCSPSASCRQPDRPKGIH